LLFSSYHLFESTYEDDKAIFEAKFPGRVSVDRPAAFLAVKATTAAAPAVVNVPPDYPILQQAAPVVQGHVLQGEPSRIVTGKVIGIGAVAPASTTHTEGSFVVGKDYVPVPGQVAQPYQYPAKPGAHEELRPQQQTTYTSDADFKA